MAARGRTLEEVTVGLLLDGDDADLERLADACSDAARNKAECPNCGDAGPHEDNGASGEDLSFCCRSCGCCFDPPTTVTY